MRSKTHSTRALLWAALRKRFSLINDKASDEVIDTDLRAGVEMRGTNLWVLIFAIFIASIGLNVNSTAVIIGAMLISPLMGPILGIGYGVGVLDTALIRKALKNLGIAAGISLATSTLYFLISPLDTATSELLARTSPTIWDVLIALFGGFAGIIGVTRREKSNIIPGVAIATALMPPLCTAGFGIAHGNLAYLGGAAFLFAINCVFIAFSAGVVTRGFHVQKTTFVDQQMARRVQRYINAIVIATLVPSGYLAYQLVQEEFFKARAQAFIAQEFENNQWHVTQSTVVPEQRKIEITLIGDYVSSAKLAEISSRLGGNGLSGAQIQLHQVKDNQIDISSLKSSLLGDLYSQSQQTIAEKDKRIDELQTMVNAQQSRARQLAPIAAELQVLFPQLSNILVSHATPNTQDTPTHPPTTLVVNAQSAQPLSAADQLKLQQWLKLKQAGAAVKVVIETPKPLPKPPKRYK